MRNQPEDRTPIRVPMQWEKETEEYNTFAISRDLVLTVNWQAQQIEELRFRLDRAEMLLKDTDPAAVLAARKKVMDTSVGEAPHA